MSLSDIIANPARLAALVSDAATAAPRLISEPEMPQGSQEWLNWRKGGVTATDMAVVLNGRHYGKTAHDVWAEKVGLVVPEEPSEALKAVFARGHRDEPVIRAEACRQEGLYFMPCCCQAANVPFLKGSLDGLAFDQAGKPVLLECKSLSSLAEIRANPLGNARLQGYTKQVKYMMALCHAEIAFIYMGVTSPEGTLIDLFKAEISLSQEEARHIVEAAVRFYACCLYKEDPDTSPFMEGFRVLEVEAPAPAVSPAPAPAPAPADPEIFSPGPGPKELEALDNAVIAAQGSSAAPEFRDAGEELAYLSNEIARLEARKKELVAKCYKEGNLSFAAGEIKRTVTKGSIDYGKLCSFIIQEFNLNIPDDVTEKFRKANSERTAFYARKEKKPAEKPAE